MKNFTTRRFVAGIGIAALIGTLSLTAGSMPASAVQSRAAVPTTAAAAHLTNLAHLNFLLDKTSPAAIAGHTTYKLAEQPALTVPWVYADPRPGGAFALVGGGPLNPATGHWGQGSYDADDITRAAVVYLRDWKQTGSESSRQTAYELLRSVAYFQTSSGPNAGNVILWMQPDGQLNPSPTPVELPSPSDSGASYWLARSLWAFGEGYADFKSVDPAFARFLQQRLQLGVSALNREVFNKYGQFAVADGVKVPAWLIVNGADASAEAVLGLSAYSTAAPSDTPAHTALKELSEGIADMGSGDPTSWPYGAILPWTQSRSIWHAYASQMPEALAVASTTLDKPSLLAPAIADSVSFTTTMLTAGGPDNGWYPTPTDTTQIAYGADSRLQSLLAVAKAANRPGLRELAGMMGAWYFGANPSGKPTYDPANGVTFDGVQPDGSVNHGSGAESTIHGLLSMLALDANPDVSARAQATTTVAARDGLTVIQAEKSRSTTGIVVTPASAWTGESQYGGGGYLQLTAGQKATFTLPASSGARHVEPVDFEPYPGSTRSFWRTGELPLGLVNDAVGAQGVTAIPGALLPKPLKLPVPAFKSDVSVTTLYGVTKIDALIVRPLISRLILTGTTSSTELVHSTSNVPVPAIVGTAGQRATLRSYDSSGVLVRAGAIDGTATIVLRAEGFAVITR
jgi:hypothetical protein